MYLHQCTLVRTSTNPERRKRVLGIYQGKSQVSQISSRLEEGNEGKCWLRGWKRARRSKVPLVLNRSPHGNKKHRDRFQLSHWQLNLEIWRQNSASERTIHELTSLGMAEDGLLKSSGRGTLRYRTLVL